MNPLTKKTGFEQVQLSSLSLPTPTYQTGVKQPDGSYTLGQQPEKNTPLSTATSGEATAGSIFGVSDADKKYMADAPTYTQTTPGISLDEESRIRAEATARLQAEMDAAKQVFDKMVLDATKAGNNRLGQSTALQARHGMLAGDVGAAIDNETTVYNQKEIASIEAQRLAKYNSIQTQSRADVDLELQNKRAAAKQGYDAYMAYIKGTDERAKVRTTNVARAAVAKGLDFLTDKALLKQAAKDAQIDETALLAAYQAESDARAEKEMDLKYKQSQITKNLGAEKGFGELADGAVLYDKNTGEIRYENKKDFAQKAARTTSALGIPEGKFKSNLDATASRVSLLVGPQSRDDYWATISQSRDEMDAVRTIAATAMKNGLTADARTDVIQQNKAIPSLDAAIALIDSGINSGALQAATQYTYNVFGKDFDPKLAQINQYITSALQPYRNSITGAAWGVQEDKEYQNLFGGTKYSPKELRQRLVGVRDIMKKGILSTLDAGIDPVSFGNGFTSEALGEQRQGIPQKNNYMDAVQEYRKNNPNATIDEVRQYFKNNPIETGPTSLNVNPERTLSFSNPEGESGNVLRMSREAIARIESRGSGDYEALGKITKSGDRAYGRYQVMGNNIPAWTRQTFGKAMSPQQFLQNPEAQDAVFNHIFGALIEQYGNPYDAASIWFSGKPLKGNYARDINNTSVPQYVAAFDKHLKSLNG